MGASPLRGWQLRAAAILAIVCAIAFCGTGTARAATPAAGTISSSQTSVGFTGQLTAPNFFECPSQAADPVNLVCEHFTVTVADAGTVQACVSFPPGTGMNDVDVFVFDQTGNQVTTTGGVSASNDPECASFITTSGTFEIRVNPVFVEGPIDISGTVTLTPTNGGGGGGGGGGIDPPVYVSDASAVAPDTGVVNMDFTVSLGWATSVPVTINYATLDATPLMPVDYPATAGIDYVPVAGTVVFAPGETVHTVSVPIMAELLPKPDVQFIVQLALPEPAVVIARIGRGHGYGTIFDNKTKSRVVGGGTLLGLTGGGTFSLRAAENGVGKIRYSEGSGVRFKSTSIGTVAFNNTLHSATITGSGTNNGVSVTFVLQVGDNGPGGTLDDFVLTLSDGTKATGPLTRGDIRYSSG